MSLMQDFHKRMDRRITEIDLASMDESILRLCRNALEEAAGDEVPHTFSHLVAMYAVANGSEDILPRRLLDQIAAAIDAWKALKYSPVTSKLAETLRQGGPR